MANSEALQELQSRLASRLQAARSEGVSANWLAVKAGGRNYLLPLSQSGEIYPLAHLQSVPYTRPWFMGVINIRGGLFGVVDLASAFRAEKNLSRAFSFLSVIVLCPYIQRCLLTQPETVFSGLPRIGFWC